MTWFAFQDPWMLGLLALLPLLVWRHHRRPAAALAYSRLPTGAGRAWRLHLPFYLRLAALALLIVAVARPQRGFAWEESMTEGIDIQLALDLSGSMGAEDFGSTDRLTVAKRVVRDFVAGRPADRIGLTVFAGAAMTRAPLTADHRMVDELVRDLELHTLPDGTAIGDAMAAAAARLKESAAESKVLVLVTDGANNAGAVDPASAAAICDGLGIRIYTVAVGRGGRVTVPVQMQNPLTGQVELRKVNVLMRVDRELLRRIAERTGGRYFEATDRAGLEAAFASVDQLERTPLESRRWVRYRETFPPLAVVALGLILLPIAATAAGITVEP